MAQRVVTALVDDITGKEIPAGQGETISFAVNGLTYEIDLDDRNAKKFHDTLSFYVDHGRKVGRVNVTPMRRRTKNEDLDLAAVRAWAESNGYEVSARGRVKNEIIEAFRAANA